jgi:hypothetical protein
MNKNPIAEYLSSVTPEKVNTAFLAYLCNLREIAQVSPEIARSIVG